MWDLRQPRTGGSPEAIVARPHAAAPQRQQARCPQGARVLTVHEPVGRTVATMGGPVELQRPSVAGRACRVGLYPLDEARGLVAGCPQLDRQHAAAQLVTAGPYDTAPSLLAALTGMHCGSARLHTVPHPGGVGVSGLDGAPAHQEMERRLAAGSAGRLRRPVLGVGIAGAAVPPRPDSARAPCEGRRGKRAQRTRGQGQGAPHRAGASLGWMASVACMGSVGIRDKRRHNVGQLAGRSTRPA